MLGANPAGYQGATEDRYPKPMHNCPGILLIGHGTRNRQGRSEFAQLTQAVQELLPQHTVSPCFLELAEPSISQAVRAAAARGARQLVALPVLLFAAGHAKRDIPQELAAAASETGVSIQQLEPIGYAQEVLELSRLRYVELLDSRTHQAESETVLVMVGRGSPDREAIAEFQTLARLSAEQRRVGQLEVAFLAMAEPPLDVVLSSLAERNPTRVVVQPHLLFSGQLYDRIDAAVSQQAKQFPQTEWLTTAILGPHATLTSAIASRATSATACKAASQADGDSSMRSERNSWRVL